MSIGRALTGWAGYAAVALVGAVLAWTAQGLARRRPACQG